MDMIVARKTIFFLVGVLFTGWVVEIVVNLVKKTVKLLVTSFQILENGRAGAEGLQLV